MVLKDLKERQDQKALKARLVQKVHKESQQLLLLELSHLQKVC
jgi:hypothetical protein